MHSRPTHLLTLLFLVISHLALAQAPVAVIKTITPASFREKAARSKVLLLDVRTPAEFNQGHLPQAVNLNFYEPDFKARLKKLIQADGREVLVYCAVGGRSAKAAEVLAEMKAPHIYNLAGGFTAWQQAGFPVVKPTQ